MDIMQAGIGRTDGRRIPFADMRQLPIGRNGACLAQQLLQIRIRDAWRNAASQAVHDLRTDFSRRFCFLHD